MNGPVVGQPLVLVVEDEPQMRRFLVSTLVSHGFRSLHMSTRLGAREGLSGRNPDLVVLDVGHAGIDGVGLTERLRESIAAPIVAVLNTSDEEDRLRLLDAGADDYLVKPFGSGDLVARVRVWLKQSARTVREPGGGSPRLSIDRDRHCLVVDGREVHITPLEYKLVEALARTSVPLTEPQILRAVWGQGAVPPAQYLRANVRQLRQKMEKDPSRPRYLLGDPTGGYRIRLAWRA